MTCVGRFIYCFNYYYSLNRSFAKLRQEGRRKMTSNPPTVLLIDIVPDRRELLLYVYITFNLTVISAGLFASVLRIQPVYGLPMAT